MPTTNDRIPLCLLDSDTASKRTWKKIVARMARSGRWDDAVIDDICGWGTLSESELPIVLHRPKMMQQRDYITCYSVFSTLQDEAFREIGHDPSTREQTAQFISDSIHCNLDQLWFCLGLFGGFGLPQGTTAYTHEDDLHRALLRAHLSFWDWYCKHEDRFYTNVSIFLAGTGSDLDSHNSRLNHWQEWSGMLPILCKSIGKGPADFQHIRTLLPEDAGAVMKEWLRAYDQTG